MLRSLITAPSENFCLQLHHLQKTYGVSEHGPWTRKIPPDGAKRCELDALKRESAWAGEEVQNVKFLNFDAMASDKNHAEFSKCCRNRNVVTANIFVETSRPSHGFCGISAPTGLVSSAAGGIKFTVSTGSSVYPCRHS